MRGNALTIKLPRLHGRDCMGRWTTRRDYSQSGVRKFHSHECGQLRDRGWRCLPMHVKQCRLHSFVHTSPFDSGGRIAMKSTRMRALLLAGAAGVLTLGLAGPACAAETSATVTVT